MPSRKLTLIIFSELLNVKLELISGLVPFPFRSCPAHLEAGLTRVVLEETRNHFHGSEDGGLSLNDPASIELRADMADSPAMPLAAAGGQLRSKDEQS